MPSLADQIISIMLVREDVNVKINIPGTWYNYEIGKPGNKGQSQFALVWKLFLLSGILEKLVCSGY